MTKLATVSIAYAVRFARPTHVHQLLSVSDAIINLYATVYQAQLEIHTLNVLDIMNHLNVHRTLNAHHT